MTWERFFSEKILARGQDYYKQNAVTHLETIHDTVQAVVSGSVPYYVTIKMQGTMPVKWKCTCPYIENHDDCKHITAVLYALEAEQKKQNSACREDLFSTIKSIPENEAKQILLDLISEHPELAEKISEKFVIVSPEMLKEIKQKIRQALQRAGGKYHFIEYYNAHRLLREFIYILDHEIASLIQAGHFLISFELICYMLEQYARYDIDDSNGETQDLYNYCSTYWKQIIKQANDEQEEQLYKVVTKILAKDIDSDFKSFLFDTQVNLFTAPSILKKNLSIIDEKIQTVECEQNKFIREYAIGNYAIMKISLMERLGYSNQEIQTVIDKYWQSSFVRSELTAKAIEAEQFYKAIQILEESKEIDCDNPNALNKYSNQLIPLYEKTNQQEKLKQELIFAVFHTYFNSSNLEKLKNIAKKEEWDCISKKIQENTRLKSYYPYVYKLENNMNKLLAYVLSANSLQELTAWEDDLKKYFPYELCKLYQTLLFEEMKNATNRKEYAYLINYFKKIAAYPQGKEVIFYLTNTWKQCYPRRTAMLDELAKIKY